MKSFQYELSAAVTVAILLLSLQSCRSYPEIRRSLNHNPSTGVLYEPGELDIAIDYSRNLLSEALSKSGTETVPVEFQQLQTVIIETFREEYPLSDIHAVNNESTSTDEVLIKVDLSLYYEAFEKDNALELNARVGLFFTDNRTGRQIRYIPRLVEATVTDRYEKLSLDHFIWVLPPLEILPELKQKIEAETIKLIKQIKEK